jgi:hypothetical protein
LATKARKKPAAEKNPVAALLDNMMPDDAEEDLYTFLDEVGTGISTVDIFRLNKDGSRPHVDRVTLDALKDDVYGYLRTLGAAKYLLQFKSADRLIRKSKVIEVAGAVSPNGVAPQPAGASDHVTFLREQMAQQQTLLLALISNLGNKGSGPDLSFLSGVLKPPDMMPMVTLMAAMIGKKDEGSGLALAQTIVKMSRDLAPEGGRGDDSWLSVIKDVGGKVVDNIGGAFRQPGQPAALLPAGSPIPPAAPARPVVQADPGPVGGNPIVTRENFAAYLGQALIYLKTKAAANKDVETIADYIVENSEEPQWTAVLGVIEQGATFENLLQFDPEIGQAPQLRAWFEKLYHELHDAIFNDVDRAGKGGNANNPGSNAGAGAPGPNPPDGTTGS